MKSSGIEPTTFRLVAYCLKKLPYCVPQQCLQYDDDYYIIIHVMVI
jgi:hypothetical protein